MQLRAPVMLAIPARGINGRLRLPWKNGQRASKEMPEKSKPSLAPWEVDHFIRPYSEAIRDRLGLYFELHGLPISQSWLALLALAKARELRLSPPGSLPLSRKPGDGKVLLVDVNATNGEVHPFFAGRPAAASLTGP